jgi:hypothetical protein
MPTKLALPKLFERASRGVETGDAVFGVSFEKANSPPRITARRGGGVVNELMRSFHIDAAGVVFLIPSHRNTTPASREAEAARYFLIARPPLLAVMRGGEFALLKNTV